MYAPTAAGSGPPRKEPRVTVVFQHTDEDLVRGGGLEGPQAAGARCKGFRRCFAAALDMPRCQGMPAVKQVPQEVLSRRGRAPIAAGAAAAARASRPAGALAATLRHPPPSSPHPRPAAPTPLPSPALCRRRGACDEQQRPAVHGVARLDDSQVRVPQRQQRRRQLQCLAAPLLANPCLLAALQLFAGAAQLQTLASPSLTGGTLAAAARAAARGLRATLTGSTAWRWSAASCSPPAPRTAPSSCGKPPRRVSTGFVLTAGAWWPGAVCSWRVRRPALLLVFLPPQPPSC